MRSADRLLNGGLLKQNPGIIDQRGQRLTFTIEAVKHRQHLRFIADICAHGKRFTARVNDLVDHVRCGLNVVVIVHRHGVTFAGQLQRGGFPMPRLAPVTSAIAIASPNKSRVALTPYPAYVTTAEYYWYSLIGTQEQNRLRSP
jgi:hypothetical protein